jgi:hypothetical protein
MAGEKGLRKGGDSPAEPIQTTKSREASINSGRELKVLAKVHRGKRW